MRPTLASMVDPFVVVREPLSLDEFFRIEQVLIELVDGQPVLMSAASGPHQYAVTRLVRAIDDACPPGTVVVPSPIDWVLWEVPRATVRQPDLAVVRIEQARAIRLTEPPLLAVEVLSPSSLERDLVAKRRDYARAGCRHYWIVNLSVPEVVVLTRQGDEFVETVRAVGPRAVALTEPFAVTLRAADLVL